MTSASTPLLRDLIDIPERVNQGDFVLRLTEGIERRKETLDQYVVTPQLRVAFDEALGLIGSAVAEGRSKASYLHGSFGSGKSHFMAVLHALLDNDVQARSIPQFADLLNRHSWLGTTSFLLVPFHLIGAESLEAAILGGYVDHVRHAHPEAPLPPVYRSQGLLTDAMAMFERDRAAFVRALPAPSTGWGTLGEGWTEDRVEAALAAGPDSTLAQNFIAQALPSIFPSYVESVRGAANAFVPLDAGLAAVSNHARALGYGGIVLFLDELVLWLAGKIADPGFVARETEKVAKLVESADARRAVPIISFIARQRDLRELIGTRDTGAESLSFQDQLSYWDGRFATVRLEDGNLREIARQRILKPVDEDAKAQIDAAFGRVSNMSAGPRDVLLGDGDSEAFRATYPFSPAFMGTLVHVSAALQRERTALKLMQTLLTERREELRLGQVVPLGDLFDTIADGADQPFTEALKAQFEQARSLYQRTLRPMLREQRQLSEDQIQGRAEAPATVVRQFRADDRLIKTLLLAALAPDEASLQGLTARRLTHLNHGVVTSMIGGQEVKEVTRRLQSWAARVGELKVGQEEDPTVRLQLVGVDTSVILESVAHVDTAAAQRRLVRELLLDELGVKDTGALQLEHPVTWRGSRRVLELTYGNVRDPSEIADDMFEPSRSDRWRILLDYPFDATHTAADDRNRAIALREQRARPAIAWLPAFVTGDVQRKIGTLIRIDHLLTGNRLDEVATHLNPPDRQRARETLRNQGDALRFDLRSVLRQAYGLAKPDENSVLGWTDHLISLDPAFTPKLDVGRSFPDALAHLVDQCYAQTFPDHPNFDPERKGAVVSTAELRTVLAVVRRAADAEQGRAETDRSERAALTRVAAPLQLGHHRDGPFVLDHHWEQTLAREAAAHGYSDGDLPVRVLRGWIAHLGLETPLENLVLVTFAELSSRSWVRGGQVVAAPSGLDEVRDDMTLRRQSLPDRETWQRAVERAGHLFGAHLDSRVISPRTVAALAGVASQADQLRAPVADLVHALRENLPRLGVDVDPEPPRLRAARLGQSVLDAMRGVGDPSELATALAGVDLGDAALVTVGRTMNSARDVAETLRRAEWQVLDSLRTLDDTRAPGIRKTLARGAEAAEDAAALASVLADARRATLAILVPHGGSGSTGGGTGRGTDVVPPDGATGGRSQTFRGARKDVLEQLRAALPDKGEVEVTVRVVDP